MTARTKSAALILTAMGLVAGACGGNRAGSGGDWITRLLERIPGVAFTVENGLMVGVVRSAGPVGDWWQAFSTRDAIMLAAQG